VRNAIPVVNDQNHNAQYPDENKSKHTDRSHPNRNPSDVTGRDRLKSGLLSRELFHFWFFLHVYKHFLHTLNLEIIFIDILQEGTFIIETRMVSGEGDVGKSKTLSFPWDDIWFCPWRNWDFVH